MRALLRSHRASHSGAVRARPDTSGVEVLIPAVSPVVYAPLATVDHMLDLAAAFRPNEIEWRFTAARLFGGNFPGGDVLIGPPEEIFVPPQQVSGGSVEVTSDDEATLDDLVAAAISDTDERDARDALEARLCGIGHSHVHFEAHRSDTDDNTLYKMANIHEPSEGREPHPMYVGVVVNLDGELEWTVIFPHSGLEFRRVPWLPHTEPRSADDVDRARQRLASELRERVRVPKQHVVTRVRERPIAMQNGVARLPGILAQLAHATSEH